VKKTVRNAVGGKKMSKDFKVYGYQAKPEPNTLDILKSILNSMLTCDHIKRDQPTPTQKGYHRGHEDRKKIDIGFVEYQIEKVIEELKKE